MTLKTNLILFQIQRKLHQSLIAGIDIAIALNALATSSTRCTSLLNIAVTIAKRLGKISRRRDRLCELVPRL